MAIRSKFLYYDLHVRDMVDIFNFIYIYICTKSENKHINIKRFISTEFQFQCKDFEAALIFNLTDSLSKADCSE